MSEPLRILKHCRDSEALLASFLLGRPATTARVYKNVLSGFLEWLNKPVHLTTADDLRRYISVCRESGLLPATIRHKIGAIKSFYTFIVEEGELPSSPVDRVPTPPNPMPEQSRCLSREQVRAFFDQFSTHRTIGLRDRGLFILAAHTGLRLSEISRLSISDVGDGPEKGWRTLRIHGKGDKIREVQVRPEVWNCVGEYLQRRRVELSDGVPVFLSIRRGHSIRKQAQDFRIPPATIYKRFKRLARKAGLPNWASPHSLRHFFATEARDKGANLDAIRLALGHSSLVTTQRYLDRLQTGLNEAFLAVKAV